FHRSASDAVDGGLSGAGGHVNVLFFAAQIDAAETAKGANFENVDFGSFLRFVRRERGVSGGRNFHREEAVTGQDHIAVAGAVDEHRVIIVNASDGAVAVDDRLVTALFFQAERVENGGAGGTDIGLRLGMDFQQTVKALDDLH